MTIDSGNAESTRHQESTLTGKRLDNGGRFLIAGSKRISFWNRVAINVVSGVRDVVVWRRHEEWTVNSIAHRPSCSQVEPIRQADRKGRPRKRPVATATHPSCELRRPFALPVLAEARGYPVNGQPSSADRFGAAAQNENQVVDEDEPAAVAAFEAYRKRGKRPAADLPLGRSSSSGNRSLP
jgi:hypothetical protein